ncbi:MAG: ribosome small subunit-dependent GTPase A [Christensenellales bacterium]
MGDKIIGTVIKVLGGIYTVLENKDVYTCSVRKTAKKLRILVGDNVEIEPNLYDKCKYIITKVGQRKNSIPRPPLANIDKLLIVIAPKPEPDLILVDKLIIYCMLNNIEPIIVINKSDIAEQSFIDEIKSEYYFNQVFVISANNKIGLEPLKEQLKGSLSALCGQSAVGKSSLLNALIPNINLETQGLSRKIERGKHTTRANELYIYENIMIADTPGFSSLELLNFEYKDLPLYYPEFNHYLDKCKYLNCSHIKEGKDCIITKAVSDGLINKQRYLRYCDIYTKLKQSWERKYD